MRINTNSREEWVATINLLLMFGYVWHRNSDKVVDIVKIEREWYRDYPHIGVNIYNRSICGNMSPYDNGLSIVTDSIEIINKLSGIDLPITIEDVVGFDTIVDKGQVRVGCQTITLAKFREIEAAAQKIRG